MRSPEENVGVLIEAWKVLAGRFPDAQLEQAAGVATMFARIPLSFLNMSVVDRPLKDPKGLENALAVAAARAKACEYESLLTLCLDWVHGDWTRAAAEAGFAPMMNLTGMATDRLLPPRRAAPGLEFRRVADEATARDVAMLNAAAYGMPAEAFECLCNMYLWHDDSFGYVGYDKGRPVTTAATFPVAGTIYVALVATLPGEHGKGLAEAVMRRALEEGRRAMGATRMTLHATDVGRPLYRSMGFEPGGGLVLLGSSEAAAGHAAP